MLYDWIAWILEYHPKVIHKPRKLMVIPDALSHQYVGYHNKATSKDYMTCWFEELVDLKQSSSGKTHIFLRQNNILEKIKLISEPEICNISSIWSLPLPLSIAKESSENVEVDMDDIDQVLVELPYFAQAQRKDKFCSMIINYLINNLLSNELLTSTELMNPEFWEKWMKLQLLVVSHLQFCPRACGI